MTTEEVAVVDDDRLSLLLDDDVDAAKASAVLQHWPHDGPHFHWPDDPCPSLGGDDTISIQGWLVRLSLSASGPWSLLSSLLKELAGDFRLD